MSGDDTRKYLDEEKAARYRELKSKPSRLTDEEHDEFHSLVWEIVGRMEALGEERWKPFDGTCSRCGREFDSPVPEVTYPEGSPEIACKEWCPDCNALVMSVIFRESSAYRRLPLVDPLRGGKSRGDV